MASRAAEEHNVFRILANAFPYLNRDVSLPQKVNLMFIPAKVLRELILLLNIPDELSGKKDFQSLGNHFGLNYMELLNIKTHPNPAWVVVCIGIMKNKSYLDLLVFLVQNQVDGQELLIKSWPDTLKNYQVQGRVQGRVQGWVQGHVTRELVPTEGSWNCRSSSVSSLQDFSGHNTLSHNDLDYAESVFSDIDNSHYPSNKFPTENSNHRTSKWISSQPSRRVTTTPLAARHPVENTESSTGEQRSNLISFNIRPDQSEDFEFPSDTRGANFPQEDGEYVDKDQTISKSVEVDSTYPNLVTVIVHREDLPLEVSQSESVTSFPGNTQSESVTSLPGNGQSELERLPEINQSEQDEQDSQGFYVPSLVTASSDVGDEESFIPPSAVSGTVTYDPHSEIEISLGEEAFQLMPIIKETRRPIQVLLTLAGDNVTFDIIKNLVQDLRKQDIGYVVHLADGVKVNPPLNQAEMSNMCWKHKTWLKQRFEQSDCIMMVVTENYHEYVKPKFNFREIFRRNEDHREYQKLIYSLVEKEFKKGNAKWKCLIPVLIEGSKPSHVPEWISNRYFLYKYHNTPDSVFADSKLYLFLKSCVNK